MVFSCSGLHFCNMLFALTQFSYDPINVHLNHALSENAYSLSNHFIFINQSLLSYQIYHYEFKNSGT